MMNIYINEGKESDIELYIRELENANDALADENEALQKELEEAASIKAEDALAELKRELIEDLEKAPAEKIKDALVRFISMVLTGSR